MGSIRAPYAGHWGLLLKASIVYGTITPWKKPNKSQQWYVILQNLSKLNFIELVYFKCFLAYFIYMENPTHQFIKVFFLSNIYIYIYMREKGGWGWLIIVQNFYCLSFYLDSCKNYCNSLWLPNISICIHFYFLLALCPNKSIYYNLAKMTSK